MKLIFIHGAGSSGRDWLLQETYFSDTEIFDLPGHPRGIPKTSINAYADWVARTIEKKKVENAVLVGHSMGGAIALTVALAHPGYLRGIVAIGSGARLRVASMFLKKLEKIVKNPALYPAYLEPAYQQIDSDTAAIMMDRAGENGPAVMLNDLKACNRCDIMDRMEEIDVPLLALCGDRDIMTPPKYSKFLADHVPNARLKVIPGGTHMVFAEQPMAVNRAMEVFCNSLQCG